MNNIIIEYFNLCQNHDWTYEYSDDARVYNSGKFHSQKLRATYIQHPELKVIYDDWNKYKFSMGKCDKPKIENYIKEVI